MKNNYKRLKIIALIILILGLYAITAQRASAGTTKISQLSQQKVEGVVLGPKGLPLPGATVAVKGENRGTTTNMEGHYSIRVGAEDTLVFSYIGFKTVEEPVNGRSEINVQLEENISALQTVEINAGYYNTTRRESTGNISRVTAEEIEKQPISNPLAAMQGRMPGVHITQTSGVPGSGFEIQIRGRNSLRVDGNTPLYIIDGVPYASQSLGHAQISTIFGGGGTASPLNNINLSDIKSIEVLKDADATAIYGSRGANGVVLITTKKGKIGKTQINLDVYSGFGSVTRKIDLLNTEQYLKMRREAFSNDGITDLPAYAYDVNGTWNQERYTDWQEELIGGTSEINSIYSSVTGGNLRTRIFASGGYYHETTVFSGGSNYGKATGHINFNHSSEDEKFRFNVSATYVAEKNDLLSTDLTREALLLPPNAPDLYNEDGTLNWANSTWNNPLRLLEGEYLSNTNTLISGAILQYEIFPGLQLRTNLGFTDTRMEEMRTLPSTLYNPAYDLGSEFSSIFLNNGLRQSWIIEPQLNWNIEIGRGELSTLIGSTFQEVKSERFVQFAEGFISNSLIKNIAAASNFFILNNEESLYKYQAVFGRINYNWNDIYIINLTGRRDGSSRFGPGRKFANFAAIGAAWNFSEEDFINDIMPFLFFGKLRGSYGTTGNDQIGDYQFLNTYSSSGLDYQGIIGLQPDRLFNPDFGWEINKKFEVGLELAFLENRLYFSGSYYRNRSSNQLVGVPLPAITGFTSIQSNLDAVVQNTGWEFILYTVNVEKERFQWSTSFNLTVPENKLLKFPGLEGSSYQNLYEVGQPLNIVKVYHYVGIDPEKGIYVFEDVNNDGVISTPEDRGGIVSKNPNFFGGISNQLSYGNWEFDFLLQFVQQTGSNYLFSGTRPGTANNQPVLILDRWQEPGDDALVQKFTTGFDSEAVRAYYNLSRSDAAYSDASFIRMKNIALSYSFPENLSGNFDARIYLQGQNVFTISNYLGLDPENQTLQGLPPLRVISLGLQLSI